MFQVKRKTQSPVKTNITKETEQQNQQENSEKTATILENSATEDDLPHKVVRKVTNYIDISIQE